MNWPASARRLTSALLCGASLLAAAGCEDANDLGVELPGTGSTSTEYRDFPVTASTVLQDSLETLKSAHFLVGRVRDNVLGASTSNAFLNLKVGPAVNDTLPASVTTLTGVDPNPQLDSLVLLLPFDAVYGSTGTPFRANVYLLRQPIDERGIYNSTSSVPVGDPLALAVSGRLNGTRKDSVGVKPNRIQVNVPDLNVRLKVHGGGLNSVLATTLFTRLKDAAFNQTSLDAVWPGLAVQPTTDFNSAVVAFSAAQGARVVAYYHYTNKKNTGTLNGTYSIPFGAGVSLNAPRFFTQIINELPNSAPFNRLSDSRQSVPAADANGLVYTQAGTGFGTKMEIPGLAELRQLAQPTAEGGAPAIAINRAELLVPVQPYSNLLFPNPTRSYLYEVNANNQPLQRRLLNTRIERVVLRDGVSQLGTGLTSISDNSNGSGYYQNAAAAVLYPLSTTNAYYSMVLTGYVQAYVYDRLSGPSPAAFIFSPTLRSSTALGLERAVLDGTNVKLRVYYSKLK